jgi:polyhydroxybutyrate depolymerase
VGVRAPLTIVAGVLGLAAVGGASGAFAVHMAHAPTGCVPLRPGNRNVRVIEAGVARDVVVHVPPNTTGPLPLVLAVPAPGMSGARFARVTGFNRLADRQRFLVAYPSASGTRPFWTAGAAWVGRSLAGVEGAACADSARVFLTGGAGRLGCELSGRLAGIAAVGSLPACRPQRALPVLQIGGSGRAIARWRRIDGCRGAPLRRPLRWTACAQRTVVERVRLAPSSSASAWSFFRGLPARTPV